ncbi:MAG: ring-cleaving dioxygenase [Paracoccus sp. (in: a-proteobacteria)]|uniref:ring-cleaving dioxygenase n=1 Tax=unclassified Paracoccus (in: a-proteobacteria) TaxID=2688777 RepID=UPI000C5E0F45|nr:MULTISPECIES: ring-cleaving dioxygenase [unclassified Paracoccus (in: a-proteobacteria)]MBA49795.1 ring-cleaving dioxygenase [Paracoccus sp. (in: a-proteobacteria)]MCS5603470.1 ring-cleaving dioxygenase [Paracoccus sp. (in: a-proteobacteria)]MDB2490396.1 ring-cleaving dioxygenase [Paracoccus sp. (in: a-proteobacteria)]HIC64518.1 ring-cleaving dioxygenase [Paracoccus sp. (in: a-proteobacteria)]|tara:strand:- start:116 stop:1057 length:942 start_codon:yes stop_codon:yes gene_type:complete
MQLTGLHHLTAITADAPGNNRFYTRILGLRRVKKTVNQDNVSAYHLFYADGAGNPGTDITFFDLPAAKDRRGTNSISLTGLRVAESGLDYWASRLRDSGVPHGGVTLIDGRAGMDLEDHEGQRLRLIAAPDPEGTPWPDSPVPAEHRIHGLGPVTISVAELAPTEALLRTVMKMRRVRDYPAPDGAGQVHVFEMGAGGAAAELHVAVQPGLPRARLGAGGVHHVAFRVPDKAALSGWAERLGAARVATSGEIDRFYFRSLYFREPAGNLFELATDGPGFDADEPRDTMGTTLSLPPFLEDRRSQIEAGLKPLD